MRTFLVLAAVLAHLTQVLRAQEVTVTQSNAGLTIAPVGATVTPSSNLSVKCEGGLDCTKLELTVSGTKVQPSTSTTIATRFPIPPTVTADNPVELKNTADGRVVMLTVMGAENTIETDGGGGGGADGKGLGSLAELVRRQCGSPQATASYDAKRNRSSSRLSETSLIGPYSPSTRTITYGLWSGEIQRCCLSSASAEVLLSEILAASASWALMKT
jgi:hypothetical protein